MSSVSDKYYKIDGELTKEYHKPQNSYAEYYFIADGYSKLNEVEEILKKSFSSHKTEERNF